MSNIIDLYKKIVQNQTQSDSSSSFNVLTIKSAIQDCFKSMTLNKENSLKCISHQIVEPYCQLPLNVSLRVYLILYCQRVEKEINILIDFSMTKQPYRSVLHCSIQTRINNYSLMAVPSPREKLEVINFIKHFNSKKNSDGKGFKVSISPSANIVLSSFHSWNSEDMSKDQLKLRVKTDTTHLFRNIDLLSQIPYLFPHSKINPQEKSTQNTKQIITEQLKGNLKSNMSDHIGGNISLNKISKEYATQLVQLKNLRQYFIKAKKIQESWSLNSQIDQFNFLKTVLSTIEFRNFSNELNFPHSNSNKPMGKEELVNKYSKKMQFFETMGLLKNNKMKRTLKNRMTHGIIKLPYSNQQIQVSSEGTQSVIKKIKNRVLIVDTIIQLKENYALSEELQDPSQYQKSEILEEMAVKTAKQDCLSSKESFCNEYNFLREHSDRFSPRIATYYLDVQEQQRLAEISQRSIYLTWEEGDFFKIIYRPFSLGQREVSARQMFKFALQMAESLSFLNAIQIVHRDIKLGNFLVTKEGKIRLTDFGSCYPVFDCNLKRCDLYCSKMRTSYGLTYNNPELSKQLKSRYSKEQFNRHESFDVYCFGLLLQHLFQNIPLADQFQQNMNFLISFCKQKDPFLRLMSVELHSFIFKLCHAFQLHTLSLTSQ